MLYPFWMLTIQLPSEMLIELPPTILVLLWTKHPTKECSAAMKDAHIYVIHIPVCPMQSLLFWCKNRLWSTLYSWNAIIRLMDSQVLRADHMGTDARRIESRFESQLATPFAACHVLTDLQLFPVSLFSISIYYIHNNVFPKKITYCPHRCSTEAV